MTNLQNVFVKRLKKQAFKDLPLLWLHNSIYAIGATESHLTLQEIG